MLVWITNNANLHVTWKCIFRISITANFVNEVKLDVVSLDIPGIVLGSSYLYDRKVVFHRFENKYNLFKDGVEYTVRAHHRKLNMSLASAGQMKRLVNSSKNLMLLMITQKNDTMHESFAGSDVKQKVELVDVVNQYGDVFQEPKVLPPKRGIQHKIQLQQDYPLPNIGMYQMSILEILEIKKQVQGLLDKGVICPYTLPYGSPIVLVPKK